MMQHNWQNKNNKENQSLLAQNFIVGIFVVDAGFQFYMSLHATSHHYVTMSSSSLIQV